MSHETDKDKQIQGNKSISTSSGSGFEQWREREDLNQVYKELILHDNGKSVKDIRKEICNRVTDKDIKAFLCKGKTYGEVVKVKKGEGKGINDIVDTTKLDLKLITYLMERRVTDPDKVKELLPNDSTLKVDGNYFIFTLSRAWESVKPYLEVQDIAKKDKTQANKLFIETIAYDVIQKYGVVALLDELNGNEFLAGIYRFNRKKGIYEKFDKRIERIVDKKLGEYGQFGIMTDKNRVIRNLTAQIVRSTMRKMHKHVLRIAFRNGTIEWTEDGVTWYSLKERDKRHYAFHYVDYNVKFQEIEPFLGKEITTRDILALASRLCPKSLEAFRSWVNEEDVVLLFEVIGYTLYPKYDFNKAVILLGEGSNGKTTYLNLIKEILGERNYVGMSLEKIMNNERYSTSDLYQKLANIPDDISDVRITKTGEFKRLTGLSTVEAERKFKDTIYFVNYAKLLASANKLPEVTDNTNGFWRRWLLIDFPNRFDDDSHFFKKTFTREEIEGVITVSLLAFSRVRQNEKFDYEVDVKEAKEKWESYRDTLEAFINVLLANGEAEYEEANNELYTPCDLLYNKYVEWCGTKRKPLDKSNFTRGLREKYRIFKSNKRVNKDVVIPCYFGIRLKCDKENNGNA